MLTDLTGAAVSNSAGSQEGAQAYINYINDNGGINGNKLKLVVADTTSTPSGALTAAQKLVQNDHAFAILDNSALFFGALQYLEQVNIPVIGNAVDGSEWTDPKYKNLFIGSGLISLNYATMATGQFLKGQGGKSCAAVGNAGIPSVQQSAAGFIVSCEAAGLRKGYYNLQVPLGSTDVGPIAIAIKNSGADSLETLMAPSTSFALVQRLHELGVHMKSILLTVGYGSDLLASTANRTAAQGVDFLTTGYPDEVHNAATDLRHRLFTEAGLKSPPTAGQNYGYLNAVALAAGLKAAGPNPSAETFITKMRAIKNYDADGLFPTKMDFDSPAPPTACITVVKLEGDKFVPLKPVPLCAPTKKVS